MAMPIKKSSSGRSAAKKSGAPAPGPDHTPPQDQKGMNGSNAAPPNKGGGMTAKKPSAGRSASMPKYAAKSSGKEAPPASSGGRVGPSRAGESAQPLTASVVPDMSGGAPAVAAGAAPGGDPMALIQQLLMQSQQQGGQIPPELTAGLPPELMALLSSAMQQGGAQMPPAMAGNPQLQPQMANTGLADLIRKMMMQTGQMQPPSQIMSQVRA